MRLQHSSRAQDSSSTTFTIRLRIRLRASSSRISGPPCAKQSSLSCAIGRALEVLFQAAMAHDEIGDGGDVVDIDDGELSGNGGIGNDRDEARILQGQQRFCILL